VDIILKLENCRSFLDIYDLVGQSSEAGQAAKHPGPDMSHER
jgi:hypothetical protein